MENERRRLEVISGICQKLLPENYILTRNIDEIVEHFTILLTEAAEENIG